MKKLYFTLFICCFTIFFSCKNNSDSSNTYSSSVQSNNDTVQVIITATGGNAKYSFINDEGEIYKQGMVYNSEKITVKHFKKGTYHVQFQYGGYVGTYTVISVAKDCVITIRDANNLTVE